ncbi:MAG: hypothetical protein ACXVZW_06325 [Gaiellaceae bacterium]
MATTVSTHRTLRAPRLALPVAAVATLALVRLLPGEGAGLYLRLAAATLVLLLPGLFAARLLGRSSLSATLAASLALLAAALGLVFLLRGSLELVIGLYAGAGAAALLIARRRRLEPDRGAWLVFAAGALLGILLWRVAGVLSGDALFHLARTRKLVDLGSLVPGSVNEFRDGSLHPGYAFPLWHAFLAALSRLAGLDPSAVLLHEPSVLAPLALVVAYEAGAALFRSSWLGAAVAAMQLGLSVLGAGHGGAWANLALPTSAARFILAPALFALVLAELERSTRGTRALVAAASLVLGLVHPTYLVFSLVVLAGFLLARALLVHGELALGARTLALAGVPGCLYLAALIPLVGQTASYNPADSELSRALGHYGSELVRHGNGYALAPEMLSRSGPVAVLALLTLPLAFVAGKRRWAAFALGGSLAVLVLTLTPQLFTRFADLVSISQARRLGGFLPFAFAAAGGLAVVLALLGRFGLPLALGAGILLEQLWPGSFGDLGSGGGPAWVVWFALAGAALALVLASLRARPWLERERDGALVALAALLFLLPVGIASAGDWTASTTYDRFALTSGAVQALREQVPSRSVVFSDVDTSYRILAAAPVYVAVAPPAHVADTTRNKPYVRVKLWKRFARSGKLAIPRSFGAGWILLRRSDARRLHLSLPVVYSDPRFVLYRLPR